MLLSEELPKFDAFFTATVAKTVDTLRNLLNNDPSKLAQHVLVNEQPVDTYLLNGWTWNESRYHTSRAPRDMVEVLNKASASRRPCIAALPTPLSIPAGDDLD